MESVLASFQHVKADQHSRGRYLGGKLPFGYRAVDGRLVPVPEKQVVVEHIKSMHAGGFSLRLIEAEVATSFKQKIAGTRLLGSSKRRPDPRQGS